jgi:hypothetical protein
MSQVVYLKLSSIIWLLCGLRQEYTGLVFGEDVEVIKPLGDIF